MTTNLILRALKRRFKTPEAAMAALGLDAALLDDARRPAARARARRLAYDAAPDADTASLAQQCLGLLKSLADRLSDDQRDWAHAVIDGDEVGDPPPDDDAAAQDDPPKFPGRPTPGGKIDPPRTQAQDAAFAERFPAAARIGNAGAEGSRAAPSARAATSTRAATAFATRFPGAGEIKVIG
jgi:hypothetical protein